MTRQRPLPELRPCADCGADCRGTRCRPCYRKAFPPRVVREYNWRERQRRKAAVDAHRAEFGDVCPGYGVEPHPSSRLTADHEVPVGAGGAEDGPLAILCVSCNARKRDGRPAVAKGPNRAKPPAVRPTKPRSPAPSGDPMPTPAAAKEAAVTAKPPPVPKPPVPLKAPGRKLWDVTLTKYELEAHELALLLELARTADMLGDLAAIVEQEGPTVDFPAGGQRMHPALVEARMQRIAFARLAAALRLPSGDEGEESKDLRRPQRRVGVRGVYSIRGGAS